MEIGRWQLLGIYLSVLIFLVVGSMISWMINFIASFFVSTMICGLTVHYLIRDKCRRPNDDQIESVPDKDIEKDVLSDVERNNDNNNDSKISGNNGEIKERLYYLDNLKTFLTIMVVIHHIIGLFSGQGWYYMIGNYHNSFRLFGSIILSLNQSYFMCLFFFISGYFTPISCDKKGRNKCLEYNYKRLGIPFIIYYYGLNPLLLWLCYIAIGYPTKIYHAGAGPCWFIAWLLIFNTIYVTFGDHIPIYKAAFPSFTNMFIIGIVLGFISVIISSIGWFIFMPIVWGSLPFDILFFISGIIANRNNWLTNGINIFPKDVIYSLRIATTIGSIVFIVLMTAFYVNDNGFMIPKQNATDNCDDSDDNTWNDSHLIIWLLFYIFMGFMCIAISLTILQFSYQYLNFTNKYTQFLSSHAYTVYIIHPLILTFIAWTYLPILKTMSGVVPHFCKDNLNSKTDLNGDGFIWFGFIYTSVLSIIFVYLFAWIIKKLPGLRHIL